MAVFVASTCASALEFTVNVGSERNYFIQSEKGAFHVLTRVKPSRRLVIASPAGNTGAALWLSGSGQIKMSKPSLISREMVSLKLNLKSKCVVKAALLGSIRTIRDFNNLGYIPNEWTIPVLKALDGHEELSKRLKSWLSPKWQLSAQGKVAVRKIKGLCGKHEYTIMLSTKNEEFALEGARKSKDPGKEILRLPKGEIELTYWSTQRPLTPFTEAELLSSRAISTLRKLPPKTRQRKRELLRGLRFLAYKEKFLAGSWRFLTYFGRDTLISLRLLMPALSPQSLEAGLGAVLERLDERGEVAHEESLACQAAKERLIEWAKEGGIGRPEHLDKPLMDRKMIDDVYLLLPLLMDYYYSGGRKLFQRKQKYYRPLLRNINLVLKEAARGELLAIEEDGHTGDWRDSNEGLGWGRYPFSVNGVHIPAALEALNTLWRVNAWSIDEMLEVAREEGLRSLELHLVMNKRFVAIRDYWNSRWKRFRISLPKKERHKRLKAHSRFVGISRKGSKIPYEKGFLALSLDEKKIAVPVIQGDTSLMLLDLPLDEDGLKLALAPFETAFPDGLMTPAGVLVATGALAPGPYLRKLFDRNHYHGEVVWGWPQIALHIALLRRLGRWLTPPPVKVDVNSKRVRRLEKRVAKLRLKLDDWAANELWTWKKEGATLQPVAYGQEKSAATESNAAQLWSVAALGVDLWLHQR